MTCRKQPWHQDNQRANFVASLSVSVQTFHRTLLNRSIIPFRQMGYNERGWCQFSTMWLLRFWFHCGPVNNPKIVQYEPIVSAFSLQVTIDLLQNSCSLGGQAVFKFT